MTPGREPSDADQPLLDVQGLEKHYRLTSGLWNREVGRARAVDGIDLTVERGASVALVGESGCGKSTAARSIVHLDEPTAGTVRFDGTDVATYDRAALKRFRRRARLLFQDPESSFDPRVSIGESVGEPLAIHGMRDRARRRRVVESTLERVNLAPNIADRFPHELSGGEKQRAALARALVTDPDLLVADEPVSALDPSVQAEILELIDDLRDELGLGVLFITHDLALVREHCDSVAVMYLGEIVESGPIASVFDDPQHPYTRALLASVPVPDPTVARDAVDLAGDVPDAADPPSGCRFHTRCPEVIPPEGYEFEPEAWRQVHRFKLRLRDLDDGDVRAITRLIAAEIPDTSDVAVERDLASGADQFDDDTLRAACRSAFDLPDCLSDSDAESVLKRALDAVVAGQPDTAVDLLDRELATVCERDRPRCQSVGPDREASCHRLDGESLGSR